MSLLGNDSAGQRLLPEPEELGLTYSHVENKYKEKAKTLVLAGDGHDAAQTRHKN